MQVNKVNSIIPNNTKKAQKSGKINNKQNTSFKGVGGVLDTFSLGVANAIENGGLMVSFTLQDMLGTNLPRPIMGLRRNSKENNGEFNLNFAAKEMTREFLTGPSMFIIPMAMLGAGKRLFGKAINIPMKFIKSFGNIHANQAVNEAGKAITKQEFYGNAFAEMIKNAKGEAQASAETIVQGKDFAQRLVQGLAAHETKSAIHSLTDDFVSIAKGHAKNAYTDFTKAFVSSDTADSFKTTVSHMMAYADDVVEKAAKQADTSKLTEYVKNLANKKVVGRCAANVLMYACVMTFLQIIPKLYNKAEGKDNAGLKGLMNEETLHDEELNKFNKKDKSKPSFGGTPVQLVETLTSNSKVGRLAQAFEFEGPNVSFPLLLGIMGGGILLPRTIRAKDKYDREEILRRDLVTCAVMCFGEKALRKGFSKYNENKTGLMLSAKPSDLKDKTTFGKLFDFIRPIKGVQVLNTEQINSIYTNIDGYKGGIKGFCEKIAENGGSLAKLFGINEKSKEIVNGLLEQEGSSLAKADNSLITSVLDKAKDSDSVKELVGLFHQPRTEVIKNPTLWQKLRKAKTMVVENDWVKTAKTMNARFTALSVCLIVPLFLGFLLPAINEKFTKKRVKEEQALKALNQNKNIQLMNAEYFQRNNAEKTIFSDMNSFLK